MVAERVGKANILALDFNKATGSHFCDNLKEFQNAKLNNCNKSVLQDFCNAQICNVIFGIARV